jgi:RNA polymerase sigma factor (sigma-70 family)
MAGSSPADTLAPQEAKPRVRRIMMTDVLMNQNSLMEKILREHGAMIKGAVYKALGGSPATDDIMSEVHFAVFLTMRKLGGDWNPPRSFIYAVIRNKVNDFLRQKYRDRNGLEEIKRRQAAQASQREEAMARVHTLSHSEFKVFRLLGLGLTNQEIAESLHISPLTVRSHMKKLHAKCAIKERTRLALTAYQAFPAVPLRVRKNGGSGGSGSEHARYSSLS